MQNFYYSYQINKSLLIDADVKHRLYLMGKNSL